MEKSVKIYGTQTSRYEYFKHCVDEFLTQNNIDLQIEEINDVSELIANNIEAIPTLRINEHVELVYNEDQNIDDFITETLKTLILEFAPEKIMRIIVPVDFSESSLNAFDYARSLIKDQGGVIDLVHIHHPHPVVVNGVVIPDKYTIKDKIRQVKKIAKSESYTQAFKKNEAPYWINPIVREGLAGDEIIELSKNADLVIMGTTGTSEVVAKLIGSVSRKVTKRAKCPVVLVPREYDYEPIDKIVYAYNPTNYDFSALESLKIIADNFNADIHMIHVDDGEPYEAYDIESYLEHMYGNHSIKHDVINADSISYGIASFAEKVKADMIVMAKSKKTLIDRIFDRSETQSTISKSSIPVMIFHKDDHENSLSDKFKIPVDFDTKPVEE